MAYEYGVNLKLNSEKAVKDIDALLGKLKQMEDLAGKIKLKVGVVNDVEKQQREFMRTISKMQAAEQKLNTQRILDEEKIARSKDRTTNQQIRNAEKEQQAKLKTQEQQLKGEERVRREQQKTATEAEKQAMDVLKANERVRKEKEKTRQESQRTAQEEEKTAQQQARTSQANTRASREQVQLMEDLLKLYSRYTSQKQKEEQYARRVANQEKKAAEAAEKRAAAVAKAVAAEQKEQLISKATSGFTTASQRYATAGRVGQITGSVLNNVAQSMGLVQQAASQLTSNLWNYAQRIGSQILSQVEKIADGALEQYKTLETAEIGFGNFFNGSPAEFTQQVREHAEAMPGVGAQDLIRGIQYIAPLAGGNSQLAMNAAEGVMKSILYSGNDVSQYGTNALQNLQQLASGNFTYADIRQMLRAMPTLPSLLASSDTGKELLDNGAITTEKLKAFIKKNGQSALLELFADLSANSKAADIYEKYRNTLSGITEEITETLKNRWNDAMEHAGIYKTIGNILKNLKDSGTIDRVFSKFGSVLAKILNFFNNEKNTQQIEAFFDSIATAIKTFAKTVGNVAKEFIKNLGILNSNGTINTSGLRSFARDMSDFLSGLVKGFGSGLKVIIDLAKNLAKSMGANGWKKLGEAIGLIASPLGKLIVLLTKSGAAAASVLGSLTTALGGLFKWLGNKTASHLESLLGTSAVTSAGYSASGSTAMSGLLVSKGVMSANTASRFAGMAKWGSGVLRGGLVAGIIQAAGGLTETLIDLTGVFGDAGDDIKAGVKSVTNGLSAAVIAFSLAGGGKLGLLLGAIAGLVVGIESYSAAIVDKAREVQSKKDAEMLRQVEEAAPGYVASVANQIIETYKNAGGNIDLNSEEGRAAYDNLKNYIASQIVKYDESGNFLGVDTSSMKEAGKFAELFRYFTGDFGQQLLNSGMVDYTAGTAFYGLSGNGQVIDLDKNPQLRDQMAQIIKDALLNGTDAAEGGEYDYTQSNEKIVRDYLQTIGMDTFTTGALEALMAQKDALNEDIIPKTDGIAEKVEDLDNKTLDDFDDIELDENTKKLVNASESFNSILWDIDKKVAQIAVATGGNLAAMYGLDKDSVSKWDKSSWGKRFFAFGMTGKQDEISRSLTEDSGFLWAGGSDDPMGDIVKNISNVASAAMQDDDLATYASAVEAIKELAKIDANDWDSLYSWIQKWKTSDWWANMGFYGRNAKKAMGGMIKPIYRAGGGLGVDTVPAYLQPGEFVMRRSATSKAGLGVMNALNTGDLGTAARMLGAKFSGSWNNSRSYDRTVNNNQKTITNNVTVNNRTRGGSLNSYWSLANRMAASF